MDYTKLCSDILNLDPKIRLVSVYDKWAKKLAFETKEGTDPYLPEKMMKDSVNQAILRWESRKKMNEWIGNAKYSMSEYEKIKRITFYLNEDDMLLVTTEPDADHNSVINEIQKLAGI